MKNRIKLHKSMRNYRRLGAIATAFQGWVWLEVYLWSHYLVVYIWRGPDLTTKSS